MRLPKPLIFRHLPTVEYQMGNLGSLAEIAKPYRFGNIRSHFVLFQKRIVLGTSATHSGPHESISIAHCTESMHPLLGM